MKHRTPKNETHKPYSEKGCKIMLIEPRDVINTGQKTASLTAKNNNWI